MENRRWFSSPRARSIRLSAIQRRVDTADTARDYDRMRDPLDLLFLDDRQAALVHQRAGPSGEREDPIVQLLLVLHEEGQGDRRVKALLPHQEALVSVTFDRRVPQIQHAKWSADFFLRINDGEMFHTGAIDFHLNTLPMTVRSDQGHIAAHVLGVPARVHIRVLQTGLIELQEVGMHRYVGRHPAPLFALLFDPLHLLSLALTTNFVDDRGRLTFARVRTLLKLLRRGSESVFRNEMKGKRDVFFNKRNAPDDLARSTARRNFHRRYL